MSIPLELTIRLREDGRWHRLRRELNWWTVPRPGDEMLISGMGFTVEGVTHLVSEDRILIHLEDADCGKEAVARSLEEHDPPDPMDLAWWKAYCQAAGFHDAGRRGEGQQA